jgi:ribose transport system permease protein
MNKLFRELLSFGSLILVIAILSLWQPDSFLTLDNFLNVLRRSSVYGIIAVGMTFIIISGGIDLSVGSLLALCGMFAAGTMIVLGGGEPSVGIMVVGTVTGLLAGAVGGVISGGLITKLKLQPFIATLGTMSLYRGIALVMYDGQPINVSSYRYLGEGTLAGIPISVLLFLVVIAVAGAILQFTRFGRHTYAIGSNVEAAHHAGVRVDRTLIGIYTLGGILHWPWRDDRHEPDRLGTTHSGRWCRARRHRRGGHRWCQPLRGPRNRHGNHRRHLAHQFLA